MTVKVVVKSPEGEPVGEELKFVLPEDGRLVIRLPVDKAGDVGEKRSVLKRIADGVALVVQPAALPNTVP
jgi:hypothetical protein